MSASRATFARMLAAAADVENVEFVKGYLEQMPIADDTVGASTPRIS